MTIRYWCGMTMLWLGCQQPTVTPNATPAAASEGDDVGQVTSAAQPTTSTPEAATPEVSVQPASRLRWEPLDAADLPSKPQPPFAVLRALRWQDDGGAHAAAFLRASEHEQAKASLQVLVWQIPQQGEAVLQREVRQQVQACQFEARAEFVDDAFWLTDWDQDGLAELTFAFRQNCGDSPVALQLLLIEGSKQYTMSGSTQVSESDPRPGVGKPDAALRSVPLLQLHAERVWDDIVAREGPASETAAEQTTASTTPSRAAIAGTVIPQ